VAAGNTALIIATSAEHVNTENGSNKTYFHRNIVVLQANMTEVEDSFILFYFIMKIAHA